MGAITGKTEAKMEVVTGKWAHTDFTFYISHTHFVKRHTFYISRTHFVKRHTFYISHAHFVKRPESLKAE